ncbi:hypothetical protein Q4485_13255 [Granulosicoccaceae sp. 1_MG-2023]|nr:hypothetical protein [Granulosicoccaceae sp. 1_MG-2023]
MKKTLITLTALGALLGGTHALADTSFTAYGRVIDARPVYKQVKVNPGVCRESRHERHSGTSIRDSARVNNAKVTVTSRHISRETRPTGRQDRTPACDTTRPQKHISGYKVTYRYNGRTYHTFTRHHPGTRLSLAVNIRPLER